MDGWRGSRGVGGVNHSNFTLSPKPLNLKACGFSEVHRSHRRRLAYAPGCLVSTYCTLRPTAYTGEEDPKSRTLVFHLTLKP